jgi:hypothetical protein
MAIRFDFAARDAAQVDARVNAIYLPGIYICNPARHETITGCICRFDFLAGDIMKQGPFCRRVGGDILRKLNLQKRRDGS